SHWSAEARTSRPCPSVPAPVQLPFGSQVPPGSVVRRSPVVGSTAHQCAPTLTAQSRPMRPANADVGPSFTCEGTSNATDWPTAPRRTWSRAPPPSRGSTAEPAGRLLSKVQSRKPILNQLPTSQYGTPALSAEPPAERWSGTNPGRRVATCFKPG